MVTDQGVYGDEQGATRECTAEEGKDSTLCASVEVVTDVDGDAINTILVDLLQSEVNSAVRPLACPSHDSGKFSLTPVDIFNTDEYCTSNEWTLSSSMATKTFHPAAAD